VQRPLRKGKMTVFVIAIGQMDDGVAGKKLLICEALFA
jgi:hypothetical protein